MNKVKTEFSIKDLENLSGIKAHTIRIWEKRYQIFTPNRTPTNIRLYTIDELVKLLNISFLNNYGYKISRISSCSDVELNNLVKKIYSEKNSNLYSVNILKVAMLNFDYALFNETYNELAKSKSFSEIFLQVYIPLLQELGLLWQTSSIKPIHEHFISYLIFQKLIENISIAQSKIKVLDENQIFILFLPENEVHEVSLMFVNYQLITKGYKTIYLGSSVPMNDLLEMNKFYDHITYVSYFTIIPNFDEVNDYITNFNEIILKESQSKLLLSGNQLKYYTKHFPAVSVFDSLENLVNSI